MTATTDTTTGIPDLYPSRGAVEALTPRQTLSQMRDAALKAKEKA